MVLGKGFHWQHMLRVVAKIKAWLTSNHSTLNLRPKLWYKIILLISNLLFHFIGDELLENGFQNNVR